MASIIKTDNIQKVSDDSNIIKKCGSTITIGSSGASVALACGATQTGFGRTGTVDWCMTAKTSPFTAVNGDGFFVNTTSGTVTVTLPASPSAGDIVALADYANQWATNNVTICRNSSLINGGAFNSTLNTNGQSVTLIYVDGTRGWKTVTDSTANVTGAPNFITATGGTITTSGDFKIHTFTSDGTFTINTAPTPANNNVSYLVVGGGGGTGTSGGNSAGGAGAGGFREGKTPATPYTASPLVAPAGLPVATGSYPITVGAGGAGGDAGSAPEQPGTQGVSSIFSTITSAGGGRGAGPVAPGVGGPGGSGGGAAGGGLGRAGGCGNTPPVSPPQGNNGGTSPPGSPDANGGGGGGAGAAGTNASGPTSGSGGNGVSTEITGSAVTRGGGGAGGAYTPAGASMGSAGSGGGGGTNANAAGNNGTANTGGGAGGPSANSAVDGSAGGSGIVVIRYKFQ